MFYLIGGAPRTGKSTLAQKLVERNAIPFVSTDVLLHMVSDTLPELSLTKPYEEIPEKFFPYIKNLFKHLDSSLKNYTVEGDLLLPSHISVLQKEYELRSCFLGFSSITLQELEQHVGENDWIQELPASEKANLPKWIMAKSLQIKQECDRYNVPYVDMSSDSYEQCLERAYSFLVS